MLVRHLFATMSISHRILFVYLIQLTKAMSKLKTADKNAVAAPRSKIIAQSAFRKQSQVVHFPVFSSLLVSYFCECSAPQALHPFIVPDHLIHNH